jgi:transcriptional regulator with XRE-family HTH domain
LTRTARGFTIGNMDARHEQALALGDRVRQFRERAGLDQVELARAAGFSKSYISTLENGQVLNPKAFDLKAIAAVLGVSVTDIFGEDLEMIRQAARELVNDDPDLTMSVTRLVHGLKRRPGSVKADMIRALEAIQDAAGLPPAPPPNRAEMRTPALC